MNKGDYILVSTREFQQDRVDAICKYNGTEAKRLMKQGEIPHEDMDDDEEGECGIEWLTGDDDEDEKKKGVKSSDWKKQWLPPSDDEGEGVGTMNNPNKGTIVTGGPDADDGSIDLEDI